MPTDDSLFFIHTPDFADLLIDKSVEVKKGFITRDYFVKNFIVVSLPYIENK